jgi:hypothetical protein
MFSHALIRDQRDERPLEPRNHRRQLVRRAHRGTARVARDRDAIHDCASNCATKRVKRKNQENNSSSNDSCRRVRFSDERPTWDEPCTRTRVPRGTTSATRTNAAAATSHPCSHDRRPVPIRSRRHDHPRTPHTFALALPLRPSTARALVHRPRMRRVFAHPLSPPPPSARRAVVVDARRAANAQVPCRAHPPPLAVSPAARARGAGRARGGAGRRRRPGGAGG